MAITAATRRELTDAVSVRYQGASASERSRILDEFVALTGFHRKHAIRVLNTKEDTLKTSTAIARVRPRLYDEAVRQAVIALWEASDRVCGKRLRPLIRYRQRKRVRERGSARVLHGAEDRVHPFASVPEE